MPAPPSLPLAALALAAAGLGCQSIDRYTTAPDESYCGGVPASAAFFTGLAPGAQMRLTLDAAQLDGDASPGTVWTFEPGTSTADGRRLLDGAPLRRIPTLADDPLATPDLGSGRDHTRIFALTPGPAGEAPLLGVVSLRSDDGVEVRLLRPGLEGMPTLAGQTPVFGLFTLTKQAGTCGF